MAVLVLINAIDETAAIDLGEFDMDDGDEWDRVYDKNPVFYDMFCSDDVYEVCETMQDFKTAYPDTGIITDAAELRAFMHPSDMAFTEE